MWKATNPYPEKGLGKPARSLYPESPQTPRRKRNRAKNAEATRAGDLIQRVVKDCGLDRVGQLERLSQLWRDLVGNQTASQSRITTFKAGVLTVEVSNSALGQELSVYLKRDLLKKLRLESGLKITDLRCRVGGWESPPPS